MLKKQKRIIFPILLCILLFGCEKNLNLRYISGRAQTLMKKIEKSTVLEATREYTPENPNSADILKNYYALYDLSGIDDFCILMPQAKNISEIAIFIVSNEYGKQNAEKAVRKRKENVISICKAIYPDKLNIAKNAEILTYENAIILIITPNNNETIRNIIDNQD